MADDPRSRCEALRSVLGLFPDIDDRPNPVELIALAEWVSDGSMSVAAALEGQRAALYSKHVREEEP